MRSGVGGMKIRSSLLVTCLVVVPLIAMFSHRIPPSARAAVSRWIRDAASRTSGGAAPIAPATLSAAPAAEPSVRHAGAAAPVVEEPRVVPVAAVMPVVAVASAADTAESAVLAQLRGLGAIDIDCRPLLGGRGHVASCRLPVDDAGQLQRVFQATGVDPEAAAMKLFGDVSAWQRGATASPSRTIRF